MQTSFKDVFVKDILKNKTLMISAVIITILGFGFTITNFSIGVDDPASHHYLYTDGWGSMIQQGRLLHVVFNKLTGALTFIPFLNDFIGAALFMLSALIFCGLFQYVTEGRMTNIQLIIFAGIYLSYSIVSEKFIYNLDTIVTMLSYVAVAYSLVAAYRFVYLNSKKSFVPAVLSLIVGLGAYESFIFLYISGVFAIFILKNVVCEEKLKFKDTLLKGIWFALILIIAVVIYYAMVYIVQYLTDQRGNFERNSIWNEEIGLRKKYERIKKNFRETMLETSYFPMIEFVSFSAIGAALSLYFAVRRKSIIQPLCFIAMFLCNFGIHIAIGYIMFRACQTLCFFIGFVALLFAVSLKNLKPAKIALPVAACWLIFVQLANLNLSFYNDYSRYKKEEFAINSIAQRLVSECDVEKPVVFTNRPAGGYLESQSAGEQTIGDSMVYWGVTAFGDLRSPTMLEIFRLHGYDFLKEPSVEQAERAQKLSKGMAAWPAKDSIKEYEDIIIVNFKEVF